MLIFQGKEVGRFMGYRKKKNKSNDVIALLKQVLLVLLLILTPSSLFLTSSSWYASLEVYSLGTDITSFRIFFKNCLIFGVVGFVSFLVYFVLFLLFNFALHNIVYKWKKVILLSSVFGATTFFLIFEIFSVVFLNYYYTWKLSLVLCFWPLVYILLIVFLLITYFEFYNEQKQLEYYKANKEEKDNDIIKDEPLF